jgi:hypothetical protein
MKRLAQEEKTFFEHPAYGIDISGWPAEHRWPADPVTAPPGARLRLWTIDPADGRYLPPPGPDGVLFTSTTFSLMNSGNRTKFASKRSWKVNLKPGDDDERVADMNRLNLKAMYNDPTQMREAIAWGLFAQAEVIAPRHTYARVSLNGEYLGLFSIVEEVDQRFLRRRFDSNDRGNLYKAYCGDLGCATLEHRTGPDGDGGMAYVSHARDDGTYRLKTNEDDADANTFDDLAQLVRVVNGVGLAAGARFKSDAFAEALREVFDVESFLRWAGANVLLGSWDNYFATPANYYLYNGGRPGGERDFVTLPYFTWIPWDYDNCLGIDYFGTRWQYADLLDWPASTRPYWAKQGHPNKVSPIPLVSNVLANHNFVQYYLDHLEYLLDTCFTPQALATRTAQLWPRISPSAYLESNTPYGAPFTGRQFVNDEVYRAAFRNEELFHGEAKIEGISHYVLMRYDSARKQLSALRRDYPAGASGARFPSGAA